MDDGPHVAILLMYVSRNTKRVDFRGLTDSQRTPRCWGVTVTMDSGDRDVIWEGLALVFRLRLYAWIPAWVWIIPIILIIYFLMSKKYLFSIYVKRMIFVRSCV